MTTDVINRVPRSLLEGIADHLEWDGSEPLTTIQYAYKCDDLARELRKLLACAQPAADGEREAICCEHSWKVAKGAAWAARSLNECKCDHNEYCDHCFPPDFRKGGKWHAGYQARAAQPQQAVAVTDAMVLAARGVCVSFRGHYGEHNDYLDDCTARQIIEAALSVHKTGEEE